MPGSRNRKLVNLNEFINGSLEWEIGRGRPHDALIFLMYAIKLRLIRHLSQRKRVTDHRTRSRPLSSSEMPSYWEGKTCYSREVPGALARQQPKPSQPKELGCVSRSRRDRLPCDYQVFTCSRKEQQLHETLAIWKQRGYDVQVDPKRNPWRLSPSVSVPEGMCLRRRQQGRFADDGPEGALRRRECIPSTNAPFSDDA